MLAEAVTKHGLKGYKIFAPWLKPLAHRSFEPLWQVAEKHGLSVLVHFGILGGGGIAAGENINPLSIAEVAKGYPTVPSWCPTSAAATSGSCCNSAGPAQTYTWIPRATMNGCAGIGTAHPGGSLPPLLRNGGSGKNHFRQRLLLVSPRLARRYLEEQLRPAGA